MTVATAIAVLALAGAAYARPVPTADGIAQNEPDSGIELTRVFAYTGVWPSPGGFVDPRLYTAVGECVNFVNRGPKPATRVHVIFALLAASGGQTADEPLDIPGPFPTGAEQKKTGQRAYAPSFQDDCRQINRNVEIADGALRDQHPSFFQSAGSWFIGKRPTMIAGTLTLVARVDRVTYADGTTWTASPPAASPAPTPSP
jgi:hypothetical protein